ncbi:MAG: hypothetical protein ACI814_003985 [Mariniblastus sp.]|jgi:hypothetical protein
MRLDRNNNGFRFRIGLMSRLCLAAVLIVMVAEQATARTLVLKPSIAASLNSTVQLQNAVHRLNAHLQRTKQDDVWRQHLLLNVLETQSAHGEQADVGMLQAVLNRFNQHSASLHGQTFHDVRDALTVQVGHLQNGRVQDVFAAVTIARGQFRAIAVEDLVRQRDEAQKQLLELGDYYRETMPSRERATLYSDLQIKALKEFLAQVKFEMAPEVSVGKINSMIKEVQIQLDAVIEQIDAIPLINGSAAPATPQGEGNQDGENPADGVKPLVAKDAPGPDETQQSLDDLKKEQQKLEANVNKLKQQRAAIAKQDRPRQILRRDTFQKLIQFETNFNEVGNDLGDPYFVSATAALERFVRTYRYATSDNLQEEFLKRLATLEANLLEMDGDNARDAAGQLGGDLGWMEDANQVPNLVTSIRARYSNPNIYVSISSKFVNQLVTQSVNDSQCLSESIDGRLVQGQVNTQGQVTVDLVDSPHQIHASIRLLGGIDSSTYVDQGPLRVYAQTNGQIEARRSIYANLGGLFARAPYGAANMSANFGGTSSRLQLVNKFVGKKFDELRPRTEGLSALRAEKQLMQKFTEQTDEPIQKGKTSLMEAQDKIVSNAKMLPEIYLRSYTSEIMVVAKKDSLGTLAASGIPGPSPISSDVAVRVHDSTLSNYLDRSFAGKTFTDAELAEEIGEQFGGDEPLAIAPENGNQDESFSITFADVRPIQFEFEDGGVRVVVSGKRFAQAGKPINEGLKIILKFKIRSIAGKLTLERDGDAEVDYLGAKNPKTVAFRSVLIGKLNPKKGGQQVSAELPDNLLPIDQIDALKDSEVAQQMELVQCRMQNGWLYLGWNHRAQDSTSKSPMDLPAIWSNEPVVAQPSGDVPVQPSAE